jgi:hypothetical protein
MCPNYAHDKAKSRNPYDYPPVWISTCNDFFYLMLAVFAVSSTSLSICEVDRFGARSPPQGRDCVRGAKEVELHVLVDS